MTKMTVPVIVISETESRRIVTVRQAKPDFMSVTEGIKGDALKFGFFIMREFFPKLEKGQSDGYRQNN